MPRRTHLARGPSLIAASLAAVVAVTACSRCERKTAPQAPAGVARYVPALSQGAIVVPDLGVLGDRLTLLQGLKIANFAAQLQGFPNADAFISALVRQAGVDLRSRDALKKAGLDPDKGFALAMLAENQAFAVVGVADKDAFANTVQQLAKTRLGAGAVSAVEVDGRKHVLLSRAAGGEPELGYLFVDGFALIAPGAAAKRLPDFARLPKERSLAEDALLRSALSRLPAERDVYLHLPAGAGPMSAAHQGFTATAHLTGEALFVRVSAPWPDTKTTLAALQKVEGEQLAQLLPHDAFAVARLQTDPMALEPLWPLLVGPYLKRAFEQANIDVKTEVLSNLQPGAVASLSVSPTIPLGAGMPEVDVRRTNPFRYAHLVALAKAKEPAKVASLLSRMPQVAPRFGATIEPLEKAGRQLYVTRYAQGEGVHFAQGEGGTIVLASPLARMDRQLAALAAPGEATPPLWKEPSLQKALDASALNVVVDLNQLRDSVRALPPEAWGIGGFAIKASALRWLDATDDLRAITVNVGGRDNALVGEIALRFAQK